MFAEIFLPLALVLIMGSLGLTLTPADFKRVFTAPKGVGIGLLNLLLISPVLAFGIGELYGLAATLAVGVVLLGASPGGTTANLLTHLARGDVALSVSMTAVSSIASVLTVPLFLTLGAQWFDAADVSDEISMPGIAARVFLITVVPLSIGMFIRARRTEWALEHMEQARRVALIAFVIVVAAAIATEAELLADAFAEIAAAVVTLNLLAMSVSFLVARAARLDDRQSTAIAMELGIHNTTVALAIGTSVNDELAGPAAVYGVFMFFTAGLFARFMARRNARIAPPAAELQPGTDIELSEEVTGNPEVVWRALATAPGLSSWVAPTHIAGDEVVMSLGPPGEHRVRIVAVESPLRFAFAEDEWRKGTAPLVTEFDVEDLGEDRCRVQLKVHVAQPPNAELRMALEGVAANWRSHLTLLRLYLAAARADQPCHLVQLAERMPGAGEEASARVAEALGLDGEVEHRGDQELVVRLEQPAPGHGLIAAYDGPDGPVVGVSLWLCGDEGPELAERERATWEERLSGAASAASRGG